MPKKKNSLLHGAVDLLILSALRNEDRHGWGIQQRIEQLGSDAVSLKQGSLYPALIRLSDQGLIKDEWRTTENGRRAKYYILTKSGRKRIETEIDQWRELYTCLNIIIHTA